MLHNINICYVIFDFSVIFSFWCEMLNTFTSSGLYKLFKVNGTRKKTPRPSGGLRESRVEFKLGRGRSGSTLKSASLCMVKHVGADRDFTVPLINSEIYARKAPKVGSNRKCKRLRLSFIVRSLQLF